MSDMIPIKEMLTRLFNLEEEPPSSATPPAAPAEECTFCHDRGCGTHKGQIIACPANCTAARAYRQRVIESLCTRSGLPGKYKNFSFATWQSIPEDFRIGKMLAAAAACLWPEGSFSLAQAAHIVGRDDAAAQLGDDARAWLIISGAHGLGKTGLAAAALNRAAALNKPAIFMRLAEMFSAVQSRYGTDSATSADDALGSIQAADLLILDECNVPAVTPDKSRIFEEVIRYRHARELPTLLTTNLTVTEFRNTWGDRAADVAMEASHWVNITGKKIRRQARSVESF
ncbi:MAG TPA: ATP-binding protein [Candidatus Angelobacter sp.]|jgi:DNA replication protein DnaC|nr:ATP-binding protein [Candidatus Angelobacter sp.]